MPSAAEIEENFDDIAVTCTDSPKDGIAAMDSGEFAIVILGNKPGSPVKAKLERTLNYLSHKPTLIILLRKGLVPDKEDSLFSNSSYYVCIDENLDETLIWAIDSALKRYRLTQELNRLRELLDKTPKNQNIVDLALAYNHEINNLLTTVLGNMELILRSTRKIDKNLALKLKKIEGDTQKIQYLALNFVNSINTTSQPVSWDIQVPQII